DSRIIELTSRSFAERTVAQLGLTLQMDGTENVARQQLFAEFSTTLSPATGNYIFRWKKEGNYTIHKIVEEEAELIDQGYLIDVVSSLHETPNGFSFRLDPNYNTLPKEIHFIIKNMRSTVKAFQSSTEVRRTGGGGLLLLTMTDPNPVMVAKKVNRLAEIFVNESKLLKRDAIENYRKTVEEQLRYSKSELDITDQRLKEFKSRHKVSLGAETQEVVRDLDRVEGDLARYTKDGKDLQELLDKIEALSGTGRENDIKYIYQQLTELPTFTNNPKMGILDKQLKDLEGSYNNIVTRFSESHEDARRIEAQIKEVQNSIKLESRNHLSDLNNNLVELRAEKSTLEYKLRRLPEEQYQMTELERELKAKEKIHSELFAKSQLAQLTDAVETEYVDILDPAIVPDEPMSRDKKKKAVTGGAFAVMLGFGVAFALEFLDKAIKTVEDVKRYLKLQVLGTIPNINFEDIHDYQDSEKIKQIDQQLVTYDYSPTPIGEAYRSLRTNLVYSKNNGRIQSFVITSAAPGDGKSFTSANLAISMAQHKSNTLIIDADLRRGVLHNTFGLPKEPGLTNYLSGMINFQHLVNETLIPNLSMISCGSLLPNPSELLGSHQMKRFLDEARRKFDIIIFDSPPLNAATDAVVLGTQVDALVLVIRSGVTDRNVAQQKLELFRNVPVNILGVILNGTTESFGHDGYSYYHY
ncbi:MAG: polysaccharide biosynthesis tyrosine autokinase, partial [bacterium]|nr:polysaccharide biosynthesis tyrosine autokinase [bacterium]